MSRQLGLFFPRGKNERSLFADAPNETKRHFATVVLVVDPIGDDLVRLRAEGMPARRYGPGKGRKPKESK